MRRNKFKKKLADVREIKGTASSSKIIKQILRKINKLVAELYCVIWEKEKTQFSGFEAAKTIFNEEKILIENKNRIYDYIAGLLAKEIELKTSLLVRIDKSKVQYKDIENFNRFFQENLKIDDKFNVEIHHNESHKHESIQVVDVIAWSFFQKFERNRPEYVNLIHLKTNIKKL